MLIEHTLAQSEKPLSKAAAELIEEGRSRFKTVDCFEFVPCDYEMAWRTLDAMNRGRFREWGSGFGIVTGLAELLGFDATGMEIDVGLAEASRRLLADQALSAPIETGDYFTDDQRADVYFVYAWPGKTQATETHFNRVAPAGAKLLICHGQSDFRLKVRE